MPDVDQPHQRAVAARLQDDVVELRHLGQPAQGAHADLVHLVLGCRLGAYLPGGDLHVLLRQRRNHVGRRQPARGQARRIEPQAHRVLALAEDLHIGDALDALQRVLDVNVDVVGNELIVVAVIETVETRRHDERSRNFVDRHPGVLDFVGQPAQHAGDAVLHVHRRDVEGTGQFENHGDVAAAVVAAAGSHVAHAFHAVDRFFQQNGDRRFHRLRIGAGVIAVHGNLRRRQFRKLRDRQERNAYCARNHDEQRSDRRKDGTLDKKVSKQGKPLLGWLLFDPDGRAVGQALAFRRR